MNLMKEIQCRSIEECIKTSCYTIDYKVYNLDDHKHLLCPSTKLEGAHEMFLTILCTLIIKSQLQFFPLILSFYTLHKHMHVDFNIDTEHRFEHCPNFFICLHSIITLQHSRKGCSPSLKADQVSMKCPTKEAKA